MDALREQNRLLLQQRTRIAELEENPQLQSIREVFNTLDTDGAGYIDEAKLSQFLVMTGVSDEEVRREQVPLLMAQMNKKGDGRITFDEFCETAQAMGLFLPGSPEKKMLERRISERTLFRATELFERLDADGNGHIERTELENTLAGLGMMDVRQRKQQTEALLAALDEDGNGEISKDEFLQAVSTGLLDAFLRTTTPVNFNTTDEFGSARNTPVHGRSATAIRGDEMPQTSDRVAHIPTEKIYKLWQMFCTADEDRSGAIGLQELYDLLSSVMGSSSSSFRTRGNTAITKDLVRSIMAQLDASGDGNLDFEEFCLAFDEIFSDSGDVKKGSLFAAESLALAEENSHLRAQIQALQEEQEGSASGLSRQLTNVRSHLEHAHEQAEAENERLHAENKNLETSNRDLRRQLKETQDELQEALGANLHVATKKTAEEADTHNKDDTALIEDLQKRLEASEKGRTKAESEVEELLSLLDKTKETHETELTSLRRKMQALKEEKESLEVALAAATHLASSASRESEKTQKESTSGGESAREVELMEELAMLKKQLAAQGSLTFDLTAERDNALEELKGLREAAGVSSEVKKDDAKLEIERLKVEIEVLRSQLKQHQDQEERAKKEAEESLFELNTMLEEQEFLELERTRIEDEKRDVNEMKQEMETLQAMVIAQTAQLTIKQESVGELSRALKELDLQRALLKQAEERAETAMFEKEKARSQLETIKAQYESDRAQRQQTSGMLMERELLSKSDPAAAEKITRLEKENIRLKAVLDSKRIAEKNAYKPSAAQESEKKAADASPQTMEMIQTLKKNLAAACGEVARLTVLLDKLKSADKEQKSTLEDKSGRLQRLEVELAQRTKEVSELETLLRETDTKLQAAILTIRQIQEQSCVSVTVRKEVVHTRERKDGKPQALSKSEDSETVTWFTDENVKNLRTGPWTPEEDRLLIQTQLTLGDDWEEIAKVVCGRTNRAIADRWGELTNPLRGEPEIVPAEEPRADKQRAQPLTERTNSNESLRRFAHQIEKDQESRAHAETPKSTAGRPKSVNFERPKSMHLYESIRHVRAAVSSSPASNDYVNTKAEYVNTKADYVNTRPIYANSSKGPKADPIYQQASQAQGQSVKGDPSTVGSVRNVMTTQPTTDSLGTAALAYAKERKKQQSTDTSSHRHSVVDIVAV